MENTRRGHEPHAHDPPAGSGPARESRLRYVAAYTMVVALFIVAALAIAVILADM
jgi:hypothetical protein